jgi:4-amino-4-deoxy-L-arabinose transferase-like glycosyltransferase
LSNPEEARRNDAPPLPKLDGRRGLLLKRLRRAFARLPPGATVCALLAFLNAVCWSLIMPPFQVTDEPSHVAYVQQLAETGKLPHLSSGEYSQEELVAERDLNTFEIKFDPAVHTLSSLLEQRALEADLSQPLARHGPGAAGHATAEPPLYYALETIPYRIGASGTILTRLTLMRIGSALMAAFSALFAFMFLREALPRVPWAWTVGGLGVALAPLLGFRSGGVNPDAMLTAVSAALFYCLARAFRRGLTRRLALATGVVIAVGFMTKINFVGLVPGTIFGLIILARRQAREVGLRVYYGSLIPALLIGLSPVILYGLRNAVSGYPLFGIVSGTVGEFQGGKDSISHALSYIWQLYLPRLPWMHNYFREISTTRQLWFDGGVGLYGWLETVFPAWVYTFALIPAALIGALCVRELGLRRLALKHRLVELITYATMSVGVLLVVGASGYPEASIFPAQVAEPRYLLPMLVLWGAGLALAARGAGRRWGPVVGALIVVLVFSHDIFSQLQVIARYYG